MGGRKSSSGMTGGGGANSTTEERRAARLLNQGNWDDAEPILSRAGAGTEVSVGNVTYIKNKDTSNSAWKGTVADGTRTSAANTTQMVQFVTDWTYDGYKAKVKIKPNKSK